jgi:hypothetical protein
MLLLLHAPACSCSCMLLLLHAPACSCSCMLLHAAAPACCCLLLLLHAAAASCPVCARMCWFAFARYVAAQRAPALRCAAGRQVLKPARMPGWQAGGARVPMGLPPSTGARPDVSVLVSWWRTAAVARGAWWRTAAVVADCCRKRAGSMWRVQALPEDSNLVESVGSACQALTEDSNPCGGCRL